MGNIDTGLGWSADDNWLSDAPGAVATISSGEPVPSGYTDTGLGWACLTDHLRSEPGSYVIGHARTYDRAYTKHNQGYAICVELGLYQWVGCLYLSTVESYALGYDSYNTTPRIDTEFDYKGRHWYAFWGNMMARSEVSSTTITVPSFFFNADPNTPIDAAKGLIDLVVYVPDVPEVNFNKATSGYSVTCMCKWITSYGGDVYCSPVLISSQPNNTLYTRNSTAPSVNNTEHTYQGMTFYMRKAPLDTMSGAETITSNYPIVDLSGVAQTNDTIFAAIAYQSGLTVGENDPYSGAGESEPGAEEATFDFDSTAIDFGSPPSVTAAGMVELYIPSTSDLASLAQYLWAGSFDPDNFKKLFADPMDAIIGLQIVPVTATEIGTTPDTLYVGNISTGLSMPKASRQYVPVDCGNLTIPRRLGSYLDYSPHTEMQLYLPYIGFVDISPDDCMGGTVSVKYLVDIIGGTCVAQVKCNNHVLYEYAAACSCQVPVSAGQYQNIVLGAVRGGIGLISGILGAAGGGLLSGLSEAADAAMSMTKPKIQRSGGFGGSSGLMGHQTPYIIYTVPRLIVPGRQNNFIGYPSYITRTLGDLTGFTQIDSIHLSGIPASQSEQAEIEQLLQEGVYL